MTTDPMETAVSRKATLDRATEAFDRASDSFGEACRDAVAAGFTIAQVAAATGTNESNVEYRIWLAEHRAGGGGPALAGEAARA